MIQELTIHGFAWDKVDNFTFINIDKLVEKDRKGIF